MKTFKLKVQETTKIEVELKLPYYSQSDYHFYKIYSETQCIQVYKGYGDYRIQTATARLAVNGGEIESTEDIFLDAFNYVKNKLEEIALNTNNNI